MKCDFEYNIPLTRVMNSLTPGIKFVDQYDNMMEFKGFQKCHYRGDATCTDCKGLIEHKGHIGNTNSWRYDSRYNLSCFGKSGKNGQQESLINVISTKWIDEDDWNI